MSESDSLPFSALGLSPELSETVAELGYEEPSPIQAASIPVLLEGRDVLGLAATGTGKTASFTLPMLQRITALTPRKAPRGLILVPTRELALQVARAVHDYGKKLGIRVVPLYGGADYRPQLKSLSRGVDVVVATPGRAIDHLDRGTLRLDEVAVAVLDEADEMLDMGFQEDLETLLSATPKERQTALFSATFPKRLQRVAAAHLTDPERVEVARMPTSEDAPAVREVAVIVRRDDKAEALSRILDLEAPEAALIFCRTRETVDRLADTLASRGYRVEALHGGFSQQLRERVLGRLRAGANDLVIATDVAARGIDVAHLTHVFNFDLPTSAAQYVHRIGRTGRAGRSGMAVSLATRRERRLLYQIGEHTGRPVQILPVPRIEDLRERQLSRLVQRASQTLAEGNLEPWRDIAQDLLEGQDPAEVAAALLRMLHETVAADLDDATERDLDAHHSNSRPRGEHQHAPPPGADGWVSLWVSVGRMDRVRPGDLVGAIANETGLQGRDIGRIDIQQRFSIVQVRADAAGHVIDRMRGATIRNMRVQVREDREAGRNRH